MREDYFGAYEKLYREYYRALRSFHPSSAQVGWIDKIRDVIEESIRRLGLEGKVRPDASYFLLVNFHQMICRPILERRNVGDDHEARLRGMLEEDIDGILRDAATHTRPQAKITGHTILVTVGRVWSRLKSNSIDVWGSRE